MTTAVYRTPVLEVYVDGVLDERAISASCSFGFDQRYAEATVTRIGGTRGPAPDPDALAVSYWSEVEIKLGASPAGLATRFLGWVVPVDNDLYPQAGTLQCRGRLYLADFVKNEEADGTDLSDGGSGMADEDQVIAVLGRCGLTVTTATIGGTGALLGSAWGQDLSASGTPFGPLTPATPFWWRQGESGLAYIERLDEISVPAATPPGSGGRYRTFESLNGEIHRIALTATPAGTPDFAFEEGVDLLDGQITRDPTGAANRVVVTGAPDIAGGAEAFVASSAAFAPYIPTVVPIPPGETYRIVSAPAFGSPMLEKSEIAQTRPDGSPLDVISCEQVAALLLIEANAVVDTVRFSTPRDDLLGPGQTLAITSPRLGIAAGETYWLQHLDVAVDERGVFTQRVVATRRV